MDNASKWYKSAVFYELYTRSFCDSDGDGFGDFGGVLEKLGYLARLGVDAIWFPPFYASPLRDGGYDISDYRAIDPRYGSMAQFEEIVRKAHKLGIRVMTDLVINHTSEAHAWFQASRKDPKGPFGDYYVWADDNRGYAGTRVIFSAAEPSNWTFDPVRGQYFWHRFYREQPDLNFDCPAVHDEILAIADFWADKGVDGFRLDAIPFLYEREGTDNESLPETHAFIAKLRAHLDQRYGGRVPLLAEACTPLAENLKYFGTKDAPECQLCFNFPLMAELFAAVKTKDARGLADTARAVFGGAGAGGVGGEGGARPPQGAVWSNFLRNHDFLTLELLDPERAAQMEKWFAPPQGVLNGGIARRLAPLFGGKDGDGNGGGEQAVRALTALLVSLPGAPCWYYGDEILMNDDPSLPDRDSVRLPFPWEAAERAEADAGSFLNWLTQLLWWRREQPPLLEGDFEIKETLNKSSFAFKRTTKKGETLTFKVDFATLGFGWERGDEAIQRIFVV